MHLTLLSNQAKAEVGALAKRFVAVYNGKIDDSLTMIPLVHAVDCLAHPADSYRFDGRLVFTSFW